MYLVHVAYLESGIASVTHESPSTLLTVYVNQPETPLLNSSDKDYKIPSHDTHCQIDHNTITAIDEQLVLRIESQHE
jgi:hypothetical protein